MAAKFRCEELGEYEVRRCQRVFTLLYDIAACVGIGVVIGVAIALLIICHK